MIDSLRFLPTVHCIESAFKLTCHYVCIISYIRMYFVWDIIMKKSSIFIFELCCLIHCLYHGGIEEKFYFNGNDDLT